MSGVIVNPHKLERLPKNIQEAIQLLNSSQLSTLQAAFSNFAHFDFLSLPHEIRLMIYHLLLETRCNKIRWGGEWPQPNLALLTVNKQVSAEACLVLKETKTCQLEWIGSKSPKYPRLALTLRTLRHFEVKIRLKTLEFKWCKFQDSLWTLFMKMVFELYAGHQGSAHHLRMSLRLVFWHERIRDVTALSETDIFDREQCFWDSTDTYRVLFVKTQLQDMVRKLRDTLSDFPNLVLTSEVESEWPDVEAVRVLPDLVHFKNTNARKMGSIGGTEWYNLEVTEGKYYDAAVVPRFKSLEFGSLLE